MATSHRLRDLPEFSATGPGLRGHGDKASCRVSLVPPGARAGCAHTALACSAALRAGRAQEAGARQRQPQ